MDDYTEALGEWLSGFHWDYFATYTFRTPHSKFGALGHTRRHIREQGVGGAVLFAEPFTWRDDYHVHSLERLEGLGLDDYMGKLSAAQRLGRCRIERYDSELGATYYVAKYLTKGKVEWEIYGQLTTVL